jgi:hypothetical protein
VSRDFEEQCLARVVEALQSGEVSSMNAVVDNIAAAGHPELADDIRAAVREQAVNVFMTGAIQ